MDVEISAGPAFAFGEITLPAGGAVRAEAGAMAMTRGDIQITTSTQGGFLKGLRRTLGGESSFVNDFTSASGRLVAVAAALPGDMTLDAGHVVVFDASVQYQVRKAGSWKSTLLGGEGLVTDFTGPGRVWLQTSSSIDLIQWLTTKLPKDHK